MDERRLADIRAGTPGAQRSGGSGYLVGRRLVLTCRHVIEDERGQAWPRLTVRLGHPRDGILPPVPATVAWTHPDPRVDAALLQIDDAPSFSAGLVRWGWFAGTSAVRYEGLGYPQFADYDSGRGVEQLNGTLAPLGAGPDGALLLDQKTAPEPRLRAWPGVSGAAVFSENLLTAVVIRDDQDFGNRRLHAVPVDALMGEPGFTRLIAQDTGTAPVLETVELSEFLESPDSSPGPQTPGSLLAASAEAMDFTGRSEELAQMETWRDNGDRLFSVMLITGEGGQGKTRLAHEFAARSRQAGWAGGFLRTVRSADTTGDSERMRNLAEGMREASRPLLLSVDYAETKYEEIAALADALERRPPTQPMRLLLLSRSAGAWWDDLLAEVLGPDAAERLVLTALTEGTADRRSAYATAVSGLARYLAALFSDMQPSNRSWSDLAADLASHPPALDDPQLGNVLSLQIKALTSLLAAAADQAPGSMDDERSLITHEWRYLRRAAARHGLFRPGILSDRADDMERKVEGWRALERAVAGLILLGPCHEGRARDISALASERRSQDVGSWLTALYPATDENGTGAIQPDRLAELLLGPILIGQPYLLDQICALAETPDDAQQVLFTLVRTADHQNFVYVNDQIVEIPAARPVPFASAALNLAAAIPHAQVLRKGLLRLGERNPRVCRDTLLAALDELPRFSLSGAERNAALTAESVAIFRTITNADPDFYLPDLGTLLSLLGNRLEALGRHDDALALAREAVGVYRELVQSVNRRPKVRVEDVVNLAGLAMSLSNLGLRVADADEALALTSEAARYFRQLAGIRWLVELEPQLIGGLAASLGNCASKLSGAGRYDEALALARETRDIFQRLAEDDPGNLPDLAKTWQSIGAILAGAERHAEAVTPAGKAVDIFRQLAEANPDVYLPDFAASLNNLAGVLAGAGRQDDALVPAREAVDIYRRLAESNPDRYQPDLDNALANLIASIAGPNPSPEREAALREYLLARGENGRAALRALSLFQEWGLRIGNIQTGPDGADEPGAGEATGPVPA